ncbi:MAG TPA: HRDC domain-containing protein [Gemmatimonadaceae bacterium]|nr:HRDC domain-containing protein [Gemmatimonadaceae bacterium]
MLEPPRETSLVYLDSQAEVDRFLAAITGTRELALDTEGASFHRFVDRIYLLQLSTREKSAIIDPLPIGSPAGLGRLLEDAHVEKVFHDADYDLRLLHQDYGWQTVNIFDTRVAAQLLGLKAFGLAALLERYFGVKLDKKHQRADWSLRPLTPGMLDYAAQDTRYLLDLRDRLKEELHATGRWSWAAEEFARLDGTRWDDESDGLAWMRIKGARDLTRRELALFRELVQWRDSVAKILDRATFRVVGNEALLTAAHDAPRTREALAAIRGMPRGIVDSRANDVLAAIERGLAEPDANLPRFPKAPRWERDPDFDGRAARLKAIRDAAASRLSLDPGVLFSRERLEAVARANPRTADDLLRVNDVRRWQVDVLGADFLNALGEAPEAPAAVDDSPYRDG